MATSNMTETTTTTNTIPMEHTIGELIAAGLPAPIDGPLETTGRNLLNMEDHGPIQMGFWVPNRVFATQKYLVPLHDHMQDLRDRNMLPSLTPVVANFKQWVTSNSVYRMWLNSMIEQANLFIEIIGIFVPEDINDIRNDGDTVLTPEYNMFFDVLNVIITTSPSFNDTAQVGTPMNGLLAVSMGTSAGAALFHDTTFNGQFKLVLEAWNTFLKSPDSLDKLDITDPEKAGSWISADAHKAGVWDQMVNDPTKQGYGYSSWNDFFIRQFVAGARPYGGDPTQVVNLGCETTPWAYDKSAIKETKFWIKDNVYSLLDVFGGNDTYAAMFEGGQIYQGFLSATHFHRWQSPVTGTLEASWVQPGTYFAQRPSQGEGPGGWEGTESQPYLSHVASRAIYIFNHPSCGYVAMICIGMVEVSTCVIEPQFKIPGPINTGPVSIDRSTEIGHFEFGGSTHMLIFQEGKVQLADFATNANTHLPNQPPIPMGTVIATAVSP